MTGSSNLGIGLTMFLRDEFSGPAAKITAASNAMKKSAQELFDDQLRYTRNLSAGMAMIGAGALAGLGKAIKKGAEFQYQMEFTGIVTAAQGKEYEKLIKNAQKLSNEYLFSADQVAAGMKEMGKAGMGVEETLTNIRSAIELAISTDTDLAASTDMMIGVMKQWQLSFEDSAKIANMMSYAVNASVIDMPDLAEAMKYAGATAIDVGAKIEEVTGMIMTLGQAGLKGSMAGVAVENALRYMGRAIGKYGTGQQKQALADIGMGLQDVQDSAGNMRPVVEIFENMGKAIDKTFGPGMGIEKQSVLNAIFGVRGKRSASLFLRDLKSLRQYTQDVSTKSANFATNTTAQMMETLKAQIMMTGNAWKQVGQNLGKSLAPILTSILEIIRQIGLAVAWVSKSKFLSGAIVGFIAIKTVAMAFRAVLSGIVLIQRQMASSMAFMSTSTIIGYTKMTAAARAYHMAAGTMNIAGPLAASRSSNIGVNKAGRFFNKTTGRFVAASAAGAAAGRLGLFGGLNAKLAAKLGTGVLGKAVGFMGGPVGIALSFVIPGLLNLIIGALRGNKKSVDDNTDALNENSNISGYAEARSRVASVEYIYENRERINAMRSLNIPGSERQAMDEELKRTLRELVQKALIPAEQPVEVIFNVDSTEVARAMVRGNKLIPQIRQ